MYNGILVFDKPQGFTSHDVVAKLRGILRQKRIGHAGTLDPMATGVLVVLLGAATKASDDATAQSKTYIAGIKPGLVTDTRDIWGEALQRSDVTVSPSELENALVHFRGNITQKPPMYSAVKIGGQKLYSLARKGVEIDIPAREIYIEKLEIVKQNEHLADSEYALEIVCSKGTYIRSLCHDIGEKLGCGACMSSLVRTKSGDFSLDTAIGFDEAVRLHSSGALEEILQPIARIYADFAEIRLNAYGEKRAKNGAPIGQNHIKEGKIPHNEGVRVRVYAESGDLLMIAVSRRAADAMELRVDKSFISQ